MKRRAEEFFADEQMQANLVIMTDIARYANVAIQTVFSWKERFSDFPEPLRNKWEGTPYVRGAIYWLPDVQAFLERHGLPNREMSAMRRGVPRGSYLA